MGIQEIKGEDYSIHYDRESVTVSFIGELSLGGPAEYAPIVELLNEVANPEPPTITLNLKKLEFVNSSGISMLSKFVITVRKKKTIQLLVLGSNDVPWQQKSLKNLEKLLPTLKLELE
ncbi:MAG: slr1659 superfamily regulator [Microcoleus sp.]